MQTNPLNCISLILLGFILFASCGKFQIPFSSHSDDRNETKEKIQVGSIDPRNLTLSSLCTHAFIELCAIELKNDFAVVKVQHDDPSIHFAAQNNLQNRIEYFIDQKEKADLDALKSCRR